MKQDYAVEVEWRAFDLRPGTPPEGIVRTPRPGEPSPGELVSGHLGEMAQAAGLVMRRAPITPYTRPAFEANEFAREHGRSEEFHLAAFKAYWEDGKNLGDRAVLKELAAGCGLDPDLLSHHLDHGTYAQQVQEQIDEAHGYGITGIPAFILGRYLFMGAQPYEFFQQVMERVLQEQSQTK